MYPVHHTTHLDLTHARVAAALDAGDLRRKATTERRLRRDQDRLQRAWTQLSKALAEASESQRQWASIRTR
jgi:hypothetical protein